MPKPNPLVRASATDEDDEDDNKAASAAPGWLTKGREKIKEKQDANKAASGGNFIPEFWLNDGEMATLRFPSKVKDLEVSVARHNFPVRTKYGRRFQQFTCSGDAETCAGCADNNKASIRWPVLVIDHRELEYTDYDPATKTKKKVKRSKVAKLWLPSIQELDNLVAAMEDYKLDKGREIADLTNYLVRVRRVGAKQKTSYKFTIIGKNEIEEKESKRLAEFIKKHGTLMDMLKPPPLSVQRKMLGASVKDEDEAEVEDDDAAETQDVD